MTVTRPRSRQSPLVALNQLIWHGVGAGVGIGIVSTRDSMSINQPSHSVNQSAPRFGKERKGSGEHKGWEGPGATGEEDSKERVIESWHGQGRAAQWVIDELID